MVKLVSADKVCRNLSLIAEVRAKSNQQKALIGRCIYMVEHLKAERIGKAEWIREPNCMYRCSSCGEHYPSLSGKMSFNYCPFCGADMRDKESE